MGLFVSSLSFGVNLPKIETRCEKFAAPLKGGYCIHKPVKSSNRDVLYYLHGFGNSEMTWQGDYFFSAQIRQYWAEHHMAFPTVISLSLGDTWLLAEKNPSPYSGLFTLVTEAIIPTIEKAIGGVKGRRLLVGESMGGFNSTQLALKTTLFEKAGLLCVPAATISPFAGADAVTKFIEASKGWQYYKNTEPDTVKKAVATALQLSQAFFPTPEAWKAGDPLELAQTANPRLAPELYVAVGFYDRYLFYEGNELFVRTLRSRGFKVNWRPQWGGHCAIDIPTLSRFLVE